MKNYIAVGINWERATTNSVGTNSNHPATVSEEFCEQFNYDPFYIDEILLIDVNLEVVGHWFNGKDYNPE